MVNETVKYDTKTKAYILVCIRSVVKEQVLEAVVHSFQIRCS